VQKGEFARPKEPIFKVGDVCPECGHLIRYTRNTYHKPRSVTCRAYRKMLYREFFEEFPKETGREPCLENLRYFLVWRGTPEHFMDKCLEVYPRILGLKEEGK